VSWSGISNNQTVTRDNLQDGINTGVFVSKATITGTGSECVTKSESESFVFLNTGTAAWTALSSSQLPVKSDYTAAACYNVTTYAKQGDTSSLDFDVFCAVGLTGDYKLIFTITPSTTCTQFVTTCCPQGETIYFLFKVSGTQVPFNATANSSTCPSNANTYCSFSYTPTGNSDVAFTAYITGGNAGTCT